MRVGCGWDEAAFDFRGEVSVIGCQSNAGTPSDSLAKSLGGSSSHLVQESRGFQDFRWLSAWVSIEPTYLCEPCNDCKLLQINPSTNRFPSLRHTLAKLQRGI